jgi:hypothetical protein
MPESNIAAIRTVQTVTEESSARLAAHRHEAQAAAPADSAERSPEAAHAPTPAAVPPPEPMRNLKPQFRVDPETSDITVLMVDSKSGRVMRTIPADELRKLKEGELVQLLA